MINYYKLKYLITETFYENILEEKYTIGQSAGRCFVEFYNELNLNNIESLIVYSTVLARVARHEKSVLNSLGKELEEMNKLLVQNDIFNNISDDEVEALKEDIDYVNSKVNK
ncbi:MULTISPECIES: hypothetical protein [Clostridium]|uniref:Uncharacterized protein n=1 Tax=Clostridium cibarium TaxID=2762247 RepID=A0ABR8PWG5_9CLOT|nr:MULTISPECIES: hypothetical protein [Clostridium]MBD7912479.1 hypothetical protein [Clostridium cibarium]